MKEASSGSKCASKGRKPKLRFAFFRKTKHGLILQENYINCHFPVGSPQAARKVCADEFARIKKERREDNAFFAASFCVFKSSLATAAQVFVLEEFNE